jgi:hypothetical protein
MFAIDPVIECLDCSNAEQGRVTMKWSSLVSVDQFPWVVLMDVTTAESLPTPISDITTINVSVLDEPEAEIVRARMLEQYQKDTCKVKDHICVHCRDSGGSMTLMQHVKRE